MQFNHNDANKITFTQTNPSLIPISLLHGVRGSLPVIRHNTDNNHDGPSVLYRERIVYADGVIDPQYRVGGVLGLHITVLFAELNLKNDVN